MVAGSTTAGLHPVLALHSPNLIGLKAGPVCKALTQLRGVFLGFACLTAEQVSCALESAYFELL